MFKRILHTVLFVFLEATILHAETIYDLWNLSEEDWEAMNRYDRYQDISASVRTAPNKEFYGRFWSGDELYRTWGYDYYELQPHYENYAYRNFENYAVMNNRRQRWSYDIFGDRIIKMSGTIDYWREQFNQDGSWSKYRYNRYLTTGFDYPDRNGVTIASDSARDWASKLIFAGGLRTVFTPMTLKLDMIPGMRFDFWTPNNQLVVLRSFNEQPFGRNENTLLTGIRYIRKLGALHIGTTYVNLHQYEAAREGGNNRRGTLPTDQYIPALIAVKFADDSPEDGIGGPVVQKVNIIINGDIRPDIKSEVIRRDSHNKESSLGKIRSGTFTPTTYYEWELSLYDKTPADYWRGMEIPYYADYVMKSLLAGEEEVRANPRMYNYSDSFIKSLGDGSVMASHLEGGTLSSRERRNVLNSISRKHLDQWFEMLDPNVPQEANGYDILVYYFDLSNFDEVHSVAIDCIVGNDYEISVSCVNGCSMLKNITSEPERLLSATYWKVVKEASGNIRDLSNLREVRFDVGLHTGIEYMGFDIDGTVKGFQIRGEYSHGTQWMQYPDGKPWTERNYYSSGLPPRKGTRSRIDDKAYWMTIRKQSRFWDIGGEIYYHGPQYETRLRVQYNSNRVKNNTLLVPTIEDNDDNDQWPDQWTGYLTDSRDGPYNNRVYTTEDIDGVFPGLDEDNDGIPDTNKNGNLIPDYAEPFLRYYSDPPEFIYGEDFNNNTIPDYLEDDLEPDTPYDRGQRGTHFYFVLKPLRLVNIVFGNHEGGLISGGGRNRDRYMKVQFRHSDELVGRFFFEVKHEHIQDNIPDYIYSFSPLKFESGRSLGGIPGFVRQFNAEIIEDEMMYRDSNVLRVYIHTESRRYLGLSLHNQIRYEINHQKGGLLYDCTYQNADRVSFLTMVNRIDGLYRLGKWSAMPGLKLRILKRERKSLDIPLSHQRTIIPRFILQYDLTERTNLRAGAEALPWLSFSHRDHVLPNTNRREQNYTIELSNRSNYRSYTVYTLAGLQFIKRLHVAHTKYWRGIGGSRIDTIYWDDIFTSAYLRIILGY